MRRRIIRLVVMSALLVLLGPAVYHSYATVPPAHAFHMKIVDSTGAGLAGVRVASDNGIVCHTRYDGEIAWTEALLMDRDVRFTVDAPKGRRVVSLHVERGNHGTISLP